MKTFAVFLVSFIIINLIAIYVMGGFYSQTITSKFITELWALLIGGFVAGVYYHENIGKK